MKSPFWMLACLVVPVHGAVLYTTDFDSDTPGPNPPAGWVEPTGPGLSSIVGSGDLKYQFATANNSSIGLIQVPGIPTAAGEGFRVTTQFSLSNVGGQYSNSGIVFLSGSDAASNYRIVYNAGSGNSGLLEFQGGTALYSGNPVHGTVTPVAGALYTLTLTGIYQAGGALSLTATISNNLTSATATSTATTVTPPLNGTYFGLRAASGGEGTPTGTSTYENFTVESIPEPSAAAVLACGALAGFSRRRRS